MMKRTASFSCDTVSDPCKKKYDDEERDIIATLLRLCEPWFYSGRTIIGDSWFGSPELAIKFRDRGLYSIMQVVKRAYWPKGMPRQDIIQALPKTRGQSVSMSKLVDYQGRPLLACAYMDRVPKALVSTCSTTCPTTRSYSGYNGEVLRRPQVFEDYESHKSMSFTYQSRLLLTFIPLI